MADPAIGSITVVGGGLAGWSVCRELRGQGFAGTVTLVGDEKHLPYDRPPLTKAVLTTPGVDTGLVTAQELAKLSVRTLLGTAAASVGPGRVGLADGTEIRCDAVVVATGSRARRLPSSVRGSHRRDLMAVRSLDDARQFEAALTRVGSAGGRVVVVGGGYLGLEAATAARARGLPVTVIEAQPELLAGSLGPEVGARLRALHEARGTAFRLGRVVIGVEGPCGRSQLLLDDGTRVAADLTLEALGAVPCDEILAGAGRGVACDATGGVLGLPGLHAVGDVAAWTDPVSGRRVRREHWASAVDQAAAVAGRLAGTGRGAAPERPEPPYFWSDQAGVKLQVVGRPELATGRSWRPVDGHHPQTVLDYRRGGVLVAVAVVAAPRLLRRLRNDVVEAEDSLAIEMEVRN